jgi:hypothetical protein
MITIYISVREDGKLNGWSSSRSTDSEIEIQINEDHEILGLRSNPRMFHYSDGVLTKDASMQLEKVKRLKDVELNQACNSSILGGFIYNVNGIDYKFSFDTEAQLNFQGAERLFGNGMIQEVPWTVTNVATGLKERVMINKDMMNQISLLILQHKTGNIAKYRDVLSVQLKNATTIEEINSISW